MGNGTDPRAANGTDDGRSELSQAGQQAILKVYVLTHHLYHRHQYLSRACRQKAIEVVTIVCGVLWFAGPLPGFPVLPCAAAFLAGLAMLLVMQFGNKGQDASQRTCHWEVLLRGDRGGRAPQVHGNAAVSLVPARGRPAERRADHRPAPAPALLPARPGGHGTASIPRRRRFPRAQRRNRRARPPAIPDGPAARAERE